MDTLPMGPLLEHIQTYLATEPLRNVDEVAEFRELVFDKLASRPAEAIRAMPPLLEHSVRDAVLRGSPGRCYPGIFIRLRSEIDKSAPKLGARSEEERRRTHSTLRDEERVRPDLAC